MQSADIFHPLTTLRWKECAQLPGSLSNSQCVYLHGKLHVGGFVGSIAKLFISSQDLSSWTNVDTPTGFYGLTTFQNQIVLVGGKSVPIEMDDNDYTDELWSSNDSGSTWKQTLPPMPVSLLSPLVVNPGNPECIAVAGSEKTVHVFIDGQWSRALEPVTIQCVFSMLLNGNWFVKGTNLQSSRLVYCSVNSLVSAARGTTSQKLWKKFPVDLTDIFSPACFEDTLFVVGNFAFKKGKIYAINPSTQAWVLVGETPGHSCGVRSPELLVMGKSAILSDSLSFDKGVKVYQAMMEISPFDYDSPISMSALSKLEGKGLNIVSTLDKKCDQFAASVGISLSGGPRKQRLNAATSPSAHIEGVRVQEVVSAQWPVPNGNGVGPTRGPPTWRMLFDVLEKLELEDLAHNIKEHLTTTVGIKSLKEMSTSVIMSALLQQRSLEPDQVAANLPDYISPRDKLFISNRLETLLYPKPH